MRGGEPGASANLLPEHIGVPAEFADRSESFGKNKTSEFISRLEPT